MLWWQRIRSAWPGPRWQSREVDLARELQTHLESEAEEQREAGASPREARLAAQRALGNTTLIKEDVRVTWGFQWLEMLFQDLRYTFRTLNRDRGFTVVAVLILALGIGANVAVFSVVNTILLRPLPFENAQQLVWIAPQIGAKCGFSCETYSADAYQEFRAQNRSFQDVTGYFAFSSEDNYRLTGRGEPVPATGIYVTRNFFQVLGVSPSLGRLFLPEDARKGSHPVALLANAYWKRQFAADPGIVGRTVDLNGQAVTVVGVLPPNFDFGAVFSPGEKVDLFTPYILDDWRNDGNDLTLIGRLKPGFNLPQAQADTNLVMPQLYFNTKFPNSKGFYKATLTPLKQYVTGRLHSSLLLLWCAVGLILLIVCVNLANLLFGRAAARSKEFAMRIALGAGRMRLIRQLLTESLVLAGAGAALGLGIAYAITVYLAHQGSIALPLLSTVRVGGPALAWTLLLTVAAAVFFGLLPGFSISGVNLQEALKDAGQGMSEGRKHDRTRSALVVSEVALASLLLIGAGLLLRSFLRVLDVNLGFQPSRAATIKVDYNDSGSTAKRIVIFQQILTHIEAIPGVEAAGMVDYLPLGRNRNWGGVRVKGRLYRPGEAPSPLVYVVTPGFFRAMGMRLFAGRDFSWEDGPTNRKVVIINQSLARALQTKGNVIGQTVIAGGGEDTVVGVVSDVHETSIEGASGWQIYYPATQAYPAGAELVIRSKMPPDSLAGSVMRTLRQLNPNQPAAAFEPIQQIVDHAVSPRRFFMLLVTSFAGFGLLLASLGIYGVISYSVTRRTHEIGIRMALGATPGEVQLNVIARTLSLTLAGIAVGLVLSFAVTRLITSLLFGVSPADPVTFAVTVIVLALVALMAGYLPARRASRIDPMSALRAN
ncbi:MAG TPA: ABC transporter permease [Terriglobia bacterium]|nr:ABC transporter permease [Terriglobia bacterium]